MFIAGEKRSFAVLLFLGIWFKKLVKCSPAYL
jgi:hypothetical protein